MFGKCSKWEVLGLFNQKRKRKRIFFWKWATTTLLGPWPRTPSICHATPSSLHSIHFASSARQQQQWQRDTVAPPFLSPRSYGSTVRLLLCLCLWFLVRLAWPRRPPSAVQASSCRRQRWGPPRPCMSRRSSPELAAASVTPFRPSSLPSFGSVASTLVY
jgi:hypothetical protein